MATPSHGAGAPWRTMVGLPFGQGFACALQGSTQSSKNSVVVTVRMVDPREVSVRSVFDGAKDGQLGAQAVVELAVA